MPSQIPSRNSRWYRSIFHEIRGGITKKCHRSIFQLPGSRDSACALHDSERAKKREAGDLGDVVAFRLELPTCRLRRFACSGVAPRLREAPGLRSAQEGFCSSGTPLRFAPFRPSAAKSLLCSATSLRFTPPLHLHRAKRLQLHAKRPQLHAKRLQRQTPVAKSRKSLNAVLQMI